jgi:cytochrome c-type biogenesis protein CcmF
MYISPVEYQPPFDRNIADLNEGQTKEIGPYEITFNGFMVPTDKTTDKADISAQLRIVYEGKSYDITPGIVILANETDPNKAVQEMPVDLPGGHTASMAAFDPNQKRVIIRVGGLQLPVDPARAVITVSVKPGIVFVWSGIIIAVIGGVIAVIRRQYEAGQLSVPSLKGAMSRLAFWRRKDTVTA